MTILGNKGWNQEKSQKYGQKSKFADHMLPEGSLAIKFGTCGQK